MKKVLCAGLTVLLLAPNFTGGASPAVDVTLPPSTAALTIDESKSVKMSVSAEAGGELVIEGENGVIVRISLPATCVSEDAVYVVLPVTGTPLGDEDEIVKGFALTQNGDNSGHVALDDPAMISFAFAEDPGADLTIARYGDTLADCEPVDTYMAYENGMWIAYALVDGFSSYGVVRPQTGWYRTPSPTGFTNVITFDEIVWTADGGQWHMRAKLFYDYEPVTPEQLAKWIEEYNVKGNDDADIKYTLKGTIMLRYYYSDQYYQEIDDFINREVEFEVGSDRFLPEGVTTTILFEQPNGSIIINKDGPTKRWFVGQTTPWDIKISLWSPTTGKVCAALDTSPKGWVNFENGTILRTRQSSQAAQAEIKDFVDAEAGVSGGK